MVNSTLSRVSNSPYLYILYSWKFKLETLILRGGIAPSPSGPLARPPGTLPYKMYGDPPGAGEKSTALSGTSGGTDPRERCPGRPVEYGGRACTLSAGRTPNPNSPAVVEVVHMYFVWGHKLLPVHRSIPGMRKRLD